MFVTVFGVTGVATVYNGLRINTPSQSDYILLVEGRCDVGADGV